jgi:hypothetical protein
VTEAAPVLTFNEADHTYFMDGVEVPSVSKIIEPAYDFRFVKQEHLDRAKDLGKKVGRTIELFETKRLDRSKKHPTLDKYLKQWQLAKDFLKIDPVGFEVQVCSRKYKFAGTMDLHGLLLPSMPFDDLEEIIIDLKTGLYYPAHKLQTAGYKIAAIERGIVSDKCKRASLYLTEDSYAIEWHTSPYDSIAFISLQNYHHWMKHHGQLRNA